MTSERLLSRVSPPYALLPPRSIPHASARALCLASKHLGLHLCSMTSFLFGLTALLFPADECSVLVAAGCERLTACKPDELVDTPPVP